MKLNYDKKSKDPTYFIQHGFRIGKKTTTKNVFRIGKHSELLKTTDDPLAYAKEEVIKYNEKFSRGNADLNFKINLNETLTETEIVSQNTTMNIGYFFLQKIYQDLEIDEFFNKIKYKHKVAFNCNDINRFLTFARILIPSSKLETQSKLDFFFEKPSFEYQHILRFMDILKENYDDYLSHLFNKSNNIINRNTSVCYYDCTNFYCEIESEDDNYIDEVTGEVTKGLRKYGVSKEHRPNPIVQMGLFMDGDSIPLSMAINSGSDSEQTTAIPAEQKIMKMFNNSDFIYCADAGLGSYHIRNFNSMGGKSFIVTQSIKKLSKNLQDAVFNDYDYKILSTNKKSSIDHMKAFDKNDSKNLDLYNDSIYKVITTDKAMDTGLYEEIITSTGKTKKVKAQATLHQRVIITFSRKVFEYQRYIRNRQIERAKNILNLKNKDEIKKGPHDVTRFIKRVSKGKNGEKAIDSYEIDQSVIDAEEKYDGFYAIATNVDGPVKDIIDINSKRYQIEDCFRVLKTNFSSRPINHHLKNRIIAHFQICYTALLIYRLLEKKLDNAGKHFTTKNIITTLLNMNVTNIQDAFYQSTYTGSQVCTALNEIYDLNLNKKYYKNSELNKKF